MTNDSDLIERVAKAIFAADATDSDWKWQPSRWERRRHDEDERYKRLAKAAISAMREPTESAPRPPVGKKLDLKANPGVEPEWPYREISPRAQHRPDPEAPSE